MVQVLHRVQVFSTSGQIVVSMICKKQRSQKQDKQPKRQHAVKQMTKLRQQDGGHGSWNPLRNVLERTYRIWDRLKLKVVMSGARPVHWQTGTRITEKDAGDCVWRDSRSRSWKQQRLLLGHIESGSSFEQKEVIRSYAKGGCENIHMMILRQQYKNDSWTGADENLSAGGSTECYAEKQRNSLVKRQESVVPNRNRTQG